MQPAMTSQEMLKNMCLFELGQADIKAIARSRGFDREIAASSALLQHVFLSEQGVRDALASLTENERLGLHLLHHGAEPVGLEFFERVYPEAAAKDRWGTHTARFKGILQRVKAGLVQRGVLIYCALPQGYQPRPASERLRFSFPPEFGALLSAPFQARRAAAGEPRRYRNDAVQEKLAEILAVERAPADPPAGRAARAEREEGRWRLANGDLLFGGKPFSADGFKAWPAARLAAAFPGGGKEKAEGFRPASLLLYALSWLRAPDEWLAPDDVSPLWRQAFAGAKNPEPRSLCEAAFEGGLLERAGADGAAVYRWRGLAEAAPDAPPDDFLDAAKPAEIRIRLERVPLEALQRVCEVSRLALANGGLWAVPSLIKMSHAPAATLASPVFRWLRAQHAAFRTVAEAIEQRRGKLIVHHPLCVAKVNDPALHVRLQKEFGAPGQLVALAGGHVAFPGGLLPRVQAWMKKSGHVIKTVSESS